MTSPPVLASGRLARCPALRAETDERLVEFVRAGHDAAFEAIVERYSGTLRGYAASLVPARYADDVVQQTLLRALVALRRDSAEINLRPWLYRIAHNAALDVRKARGFSHEQLHEGIDGVERPDQAFERRQRLTDVVGGIQALPARQRQALVLREFEGRSYDEIATELELSGGAVRQLLVRARTRLRSAAGALTPVGFLSRLPWQGAAEPLSPRMVEICGTVATSAVVARVGVSAIVAGSVVGAPVAADRVERAATAPTVSEHVLSAWTRAAAPAAPTAGKPGRKPRTDQLKRPASKQVAGKPTTPTGRGPAPPGAGPWPSPATSPGPPTDSGDPGENTSYPVVCGTLEIGNVRTPEELRALSERCSGQTPSVTTPEAPPEPDTTTPVEPEPQGTTTEPAPPPPDGSDPSQGDPAPSGP